MTADTTSPWWPLTGTRRLSTFSLQSPTRVSHWWDLTGSQRVWAPGWCISTTSQGRRQGGEKVESDSWEQEEISSMPGKWVLLLQPSLRKPFLQNIAWDKDWSADTLFGKFKPGIEDGQKFLDSTSWQEEWQFVFPLNVDWPCDPLWPTEWDGSGSI